MPSAAEGTSVVSSVAKSGSSSGSGSGGNGNGYLRTISSSSGSGGSSGSSGSNGRSTSSSFTDLFKMNISSLLPHYTQVFPFPTSI